MKIRIINDFTGTGEKKRRFIIVRFEKKHFVITPGEDYLLDEGKSVFVFISCANSNFPDFYRVAFEKQDELYKIEFLKPGMSFPAPIKKVEGKNAEWEISGGETLPPEWRLRIKNKTSLQDTAPLYVSAAITIGAW